MKAYERIKRAKTQLQKTYPFFAYLSLYIKFGEEETKGVETIGIDAQGNMFYNEEWIGGLDDDELQGVVCFTADTLINGVETKKIQDIRVGDLTLNSLGKLEKVKKLFKRKINEDMIVIKPKYLLPIQATKEHPFYVRKFSKSISITRENRSLTEQFDEIKPMWIKAEDIRQGDLIAIPKIKGDIDLKEIDLKQYEVMGKNKSTLRRFGKMKLTRDLAWLLGLYVADGSCSGRRINFSLNNYSKKGYIGEVKRIIEEHLGKFKFAISSRKDSKELGIHFNSKTIGIFLQKECGENAYNKKIPSFILYHKDKSYLKSFLEGYFCGDGSKISKKEKGRIRNLQQYASVSKVLIQNIQFGLCRFGILTSNCLYERKGKYHILKGRILEDLHNYQGVYTIKSSKRKDYLEDENYMWVKVKDISKKKYDGEVYNFETESHTYCAENIVVHNCHELLHIVFLCMVRRGTRNKEIWNMAHDLAVNYILRTNNLKLPEGLVPDENGDFDFKELFQYTINVKDKPAEVIYDELYGEIEKELNKQGRSLTDEPIQIEISIGSSGDGDGEGEDVPSLSSGKGKSKGKGTGKGKGKLSNGELGKGFDVHIESVNGKKVSDMSAEERAELEKTWIQRVNEAQICCKLRGTMPSGVGLLIGELHKHQVNWRQKLTQVIQSYIPSDFSYSRCNKKSISTGIFMPDFDKERIEVSVMIDLSGSVGQEEMTDFISEICGIAKAYKDRIEMKLYTHDTEIQSRFKVENGSIEKIKKLQLKGGGGTSFSMPLSQLKKEKEKPKLLVWFSDGEGDEIEKKDLICPILWILSKNGDDRLIKNTGQVIKLK